MKILRSAPVQVYIFAQRLDNLLGMRSVLASKSEALFLTLRKVPDIKKKYYVCFCSMNKNEEREGGWKYLGRCFLVSKERENEEHMEIKNITQWQLQSGHVPPAQRGSATWWSKEEI